MEHVIDTYLTLKEIASAEFKDKGSRFIAYVFNANSEEEFTRQLQQLKEKYFKARHHCYAYRLGIEGDISRANDDGEPSGSAGRPILGQLKSHNLTNVGAVVIRYFGGVKLGVSGLINAYKESVKEAINNADIHEIIVGEKYELVFDYAHMGNIMNTIKGLELNIVHKEFENRGRVVLEIRRSSVEQTLVNLKSKLLAVSPEYINETTKVDYCEINKITE